MHEETLQYLISRVLERAIESRQEKNDAPGDDFQDGRNLAYFEVLDILKSELLVYGYDPEEYGLAFDLKTLFPAKFRKQKSSMRKSIIRLLKQRN